MWSQRLCHPPYTSACFFVLKGRELIPLTPVLTAVVRLLHLWSAGSVLPWSKGALTGSPAFAGVLLGLICLLLEPCSSWQAAPSQAQALLQALQLKEDATKRESDPEVLNGPWGENARPEPLR